MNIIFFPSLLIIPSIFQIIYLFTNITIFQILSIIILLLAAILFILTYLRDCKKLAKLKLEEKKTLIKKYIIEKLPSYKFNKDKWENDYMVMFDAGSTTQTRAAIRKYATGYCFGDEVPHRPHLNTVAVMFEKYGKEMWFHFPFDDFEIIFGEKNE